MKHTTWMLAVAAALGCARLGFAQTVDVKPPAESRHAVASADDLVKQLDDDSFDVRERATSALRAQGEAARPALEKAQTAKSLEVRQRAGGLLRALDDRSGGAAAGDRLSPADGTRADGLRAPDSRRSRRSARIALPQPPRSEDFDSMDAYMEAMRGWMDAQVGGGLTIFGEPDANADPDGLRPGGGFRVVTPGQLGGSRMEFSLSNGQVSKTISREGEDALTWTTGDDGCTLTVTPAGAAAEMAVKYTAKDLTAFKATHAAIFEKYQATGIFENGGFGGLTVLSPGWGTGGTHRRPAAPGAPPVGEPAPAPETTPPTDVLRPLPGTGSAAPRLGVAVGAVPPVLDAQLKLGGAGLVIESVEPGSLAERLHLQQWDVLVALAGDAVKSSADIRRTLGRKDLGDGVTARVMRGGVAVDLTGALRAPK